MRPRRRAETLAKNIYKPKVKDKATFSPTNEWILAAASTIKPEEREFVVDSGRSIHTISRKDFNSAEMETVRISKNPTTVVVANGEVLTKEQATVFVRELDLFIKVMLLENTVAVLSLGKPCEDHGYTHHWTSGQKHISCKMAGKSIATQQTMFLPLSLFYRQVLQLHLHLLLPHLHRRIL